MQMDKNPEYLWDEKQEWDDLLSEVLIDNTRYIIDTLLEKSQFSKWKIRLVQCLINYSNLSLLDINDDVVNVSWSSLKFWKILHDSWFDIFIDSQDLLLLNEAKNRPWHIVNTNISINWWKNILGVIYDYILNKYFLTFLWIDENVMDTGNLIYRVKNDVELIISLLWIKNIETWNHTERLWILTKIFCNLLSFDDIRWYKISFWAQLHDIWKITIDEEILEKPSELTYAEYEIIKTHTTEWWKIIDKLKDLYNSTNFFNIVKNIVLYHHERFDWSGYPEWLIWEQIPIEARIVSIIDVFDSLKSERVYKKAFSDDNVRQIILDSRWNHFDPVLVDIFLENYAKFISIWNRFKDEERIYLSF